MSVADEQGRRGARMYGENGSGIVAVGTAQRDLAVLHTTESGGRVTARPRKGEVETLLEGEGVRLISPAHTLASLGQAEDGGVIQLWDQDGKPRLSALLVHL